MAYFNFTINGHTYSNDPASGLAYGYKFNGYEYIPALGNLFTDLAATVATVLGYKDSALASKYAAEASEDAAYNSAVDANNFAIAAASAAAGLQGTSTSSLAIGTGTKAFTMQAGKQFNNTWVLATDAGNVNNWMFGYATYSGTSLSLAVASGDTGGSGTIANWVLAVNGPRGVTGATGPAGTIGTLQSATDFAYDAATSTGLNLGTKAGDIRSDNTTTHHAATTTALTNNTTNYVEVNTSGVSANTTGFSAGYFPICTAVTLSGAITTVTDKRGFAVLSAGAGAVIPIGGVISMSQTANLVTIGGIDYLKTGVLAASGSYPSAPLQNSFTDIRRSMPSTSVLAMASGNGITVAIGASTTAAISYDNGNTWQAMTLPSASGTAICFGNGMFVLVGSSICYTSTDGVTWISRTIAAQSWSGVIWSGSKFVAVAGAGGSQTVGAYSTDGITWAPSTLPSAQFWGNLASDGAGKVICTLTQGTSNVLALSTDHGVTWSAKSLPQTYDQTKYNCAFGQGLFVVVTRDPAISSANSVFTSADGITWAARTLAAFSQARSIAFAGGMFVIFRAGSVFVYTSTDGITWGTQTLVNGAAGVNTTIPCVANGGRIIGVPTGANTIVEIYTAAYGRGYHIALYADQQNQQLPLYMRMN